MSTRRAVPAEQRSRQPTEVRRQQIVRAALELMAERGISAVNARDIAKQAGISPGTVSYHFASVQEIVAEAITVAIEEYYAKLTAGIQQRTPIEALRALVDALFTADTERHWRLWFEYWWSGHSDEDFAARQAARYASWHDQIRGIIAAGCDAGEFTCAEPEEMTVRFVALVDGLALQWLRGAPSLTTEQAREHLHQFVVDSLMPNHGS
jgi:AcrR family transcriptional regulator